MQIADLRIFTEPQQGATYDDLLAVARAPRRWASTRSFAATTTSRWATCRGLPGPTDAWITLAGLARDTSTIRLGTLVTPVTFRSPGLLAISVAQVDQMSGGRVELGIGAGWYQEEHEAYGVRLPRDRRALRHARPTNSRSSTGCGARRSARRSARGRRTPSVSPACPSRCRPVPIVMGGGGETKTPGLAALSRRVRSPFVPLEFFAAQFAGASSVQRRETAHRSCYSVAQVVCGGERGQRHPPAAIRPEPRAAPERRRGHRRGGRRQSALPRRRRRPDLPAGPRSRRPRPPRLHRRRGRAASSPDVGDVRSRLPTAPLLMPASPASLRTPRPPEARAAGGVRCRREVPRRRPSHGGTEDADLRRRHPAHS